MHYFFGHSATFSRSLSIRFLDTAADAIGRQARLTFKITSLLQLYLFLILPVFIKYRSFSPWKHIVHPKSFFHL
jgi:hypothetical protein